MMSAEKRRIRQALRGRRRQLSAAAVDAAGAAVLAQLCRFAPYREATALVAYIASENEVPTDRILTANLGARRQVYLPKDCGTAAFFRWHVGEPLIPGRGGVLEPLAGAPLAAEMVAIALVPLVAWDEHGTRLGRGGGFYDRVFAVPRNRVMRVGLAYEFQLWPDLPRDPWDVPLEYVITEQRAVRCMGSGVMHPRCFRKEVCGYDELS